MAAIVVQVGDLVAGKYQLEREIGAGGMGVVFSATHIHLDQRVALKFLLREAAQNPEVVERFRREARAAVKIQSEHVARVIDIGQLDDGSPYIVMEYLEGDDLEHVVNRSGPLDVPDAIRYVLHACEALAEVHAQGIVHRDIKPANLFLAARADGSQIVKLLDFGISKVAPTWTEDGVHSLTQTTSVMGSPRYMSPEQLRSSRDVDTRSDVWALGVTLFELLGATSPFGSGTMPEMCAAILKDEPARLRAIRPDIPIELDAVIGRCLQKEAEARWNDVAALAEALRPFGPATTSDVSVERIKGVLQQAQAQAEVRLPRTTTPLGMRPLRPTTELPRRTRDLPAPPAQPSEANPGSSQQLSEEARIRGFLDRLGDRTRVPSLAVDPTQITSLALDHRAGFLVAMIDGTSSIDEILDISAMPRVETLELLLALSERGIIEFR